MTSPEELFKLSLEELGQLFPVILKDYSDEWIGLYQSERELIINSFLSEEIINIDHIGSTAIPGIKAKPTIDIVLQVSECVDIERIKEVFKTLGYHINEHPENPPPHLTFVKGYTEKGFKGQTFHIHIRYKGDWDEIRFRDYLISHKEAAKEYEALKLELAASYKNDRETYTNSKKGFIEKIGKLTQ